MQEHYSAIGVLDEPFGQPEEHAMKIRELTIEQLEQIPDSLKITTPDGWPWSCERRSPEEQWWREQDDLPDEERLDEVPEEVQHAQDEATDEDGDLLPGKGIVVWEASRRKSDKQIQAERTALGLRRKELAKEKKCKVSDLPYERVDEYERREITAEQFQAEYGDAELAIDGGNYGYAWHCFNCPEWLRPYVPERILKAADAEFRRRAEREAKRQREKEHCREIAALPVIEKGSTYGEVTAAHLDALLEGWTYQREYNGYDRETCKSLYIDSAHLGDRRTTCWTIHAGETSWHAGTKTVKGDKLYMWLRNGGSEALTSAQFIERFAGETVRIESLAALNIEPPGWAKAVVVKHGAQIKPKAGAPKPPRPKPAPKPKPPAPLGQQATLDLGAV